MKRLLIYTLRKIHVNVVLFAKCSKVSPYHILVKQEIKNVSHIKQLCILEIFFIIIDIFNIMKNKTL